MNVFSSIFYLFACACGSTLLTRYARVDSNPDSNAVRFLAWTVFFFTAFFGGFFVLGYINLVADLPVVNAGYASVVALVVLVGFWLWLPRTPDNRIPATSPENARGVVLLLPLPGNGLSRALASVSILSLLLTALMLSIGFPRGYEPQAYHLPIALHIFHTHSLEVWKVWETVFFHTFPANASLYFGFLLGLTSEHLVAATGLVFLIPLAVAMYGIGRATGADETASLLSCLGLVTIPILLTPAFEGGSDVGGAAFLAIATYFALARPTGGPWDLVLSGLAAGLAFGFKSFHLVSIGFLALVTLLQAWGNSTVDTAKKFKAAVRSLSIFLACTLTTSSFWLVRNYAQLGNPLYPVYLPIFEIFGWTKSEAFTNVFNADLQYRSVRSSAEWLIYPWVEWVRPGMDFGRPGLGPFFAATVPVACFIALIGALKRETAKWSITVALLGGGLFVLAVWWILNDRHPRYFMGALVFLVPLVAWTLDQATGISRRLFEFIVAFCISSALLMTFTERLVEFGGRFIYGKQFTRWEFYQYPEMLDRLPPGSTVVNLGHRTRNYSLFGRTHQNRVIVFSEAVSALGVPLEKPDPDQAPQIVPLSYLVLRKLGATYLVTEGHPKLIPDECIDLEKIDALNKDTLGNLLRNPINLYKIKFCN